jgi:YD repeat-containing protein
MLPISGAGLGSPSDNRFTVFDAACSAAACDDQGAPVLLVNTASLNLFVRVRDLSFGGPAPSLQLEHFYNAGARTSGPLGNWSFNLGERLTQDADGSWVLRSGSGKIDRFAPAIDVTQFFAITQTVDLLTRSADGAFTLRTPQTGVARTFTRDGRLASIQDRGIARVTLDYDAGSRLILARSRGRTLRFDYNASGLLSAVVDSADRAVLFDYDAQGNLTQQANADGSTVSYAYDNAGRLVSITTAAGQTAIAYAEDAESISVAAITGPGGGSRQFTALAARQVQVTDGAGVATLYTSTVAGLTESITDASGNQTSYTYDAAGRRISSTTANGDVTRYEYDAAGNLAAVTDPARNRWAADYNGSNVVRLRDANGNAYQFSYDASGRLTSIIDPVGATVEFGRNNAGWIAAVADGNGNNTTYEYDADGLVTRWTDALGGKWSYEYDGAARVSSRTEPNGTTLQVSWDAGNRLAAVSSGGSNLKFDRSSGIPVAYSYDAAGRVSGLTLPGGNTISYQYDRAGRLAKVADWLGDFALYKYDATGAVASVTVSSGPVTIFQYDNTGSLRSLVSTAMDGSVVAGFRYALDANTNRVSVNAQAPASGSGQIGAGSFTYNAANRPIARDDGQTYRYDASGNLLAIEGPRAATFTYDAFGRLAGVASNSNTQYTYDALGLRAERSVNGAVRRFVYDLSGPRPRVVMETDGANNPVAYYVYGLGLLWKIGSNGKVYFYHFDGDGNVVAVSDSTTGVVNRYRYDPLGRLIASDESVENPFRARGEAGWIDDGNGLLYGDGNYYAADLRQTLRGTIDVDPPDPGKQANLTAPNRQACLSAPCGRVQ